MKVSVFLSQKKVPAKQRLRGLMCLLAGCVMIASASPAQVPGPNYALDATTRRTVIKAVEEAIQTTYVFAEMRPSLIAKLEQSLRTGRYDINDPNPFADKVTEDLQTVSHDGHLYFNSDPAQYAAAIAPPNSDAGLDAYQKRLAVQTNSGLTKLEILPGNIRYLRVEAFRWTPTLTSGAYDYAFKFLSDGDAIVLDLRENGGGNSDAADYLIDGLRSLAKNKPLYILVNGHVGSAAEAVSYGLQQEKLATIVGSNTYGAANNNKKIPIAPEFMLSVSYNRPINPITGTNWEGVGVVPDIPAPASKALAVAELDAYHRFSTVPGTSTEKIAEFAWAAVEAEEQLHPVVLSPGQLQALAGDYGTISIRYDSGELRLNRSDRPKWQKNLLLVPIRTDNTFQVEGPDDLRLRFTKDGLDLLHGSEDEREPFPRSIRSK
jgi:hypothetical protein